MCDIQSKGKLPRGKSEVSTRRFLLPFYGLIPDELCVSGGRCTENPVSGPVKFPGGKVK